MASVYPVPDLTVGLTHRIEQEIKRSRFIATVAHTASAEEAKAFVAKVREEFADARHNCWAYCACAPGTTRQIGASDDGEPHGTAGRPMLTVLQHCGIGEIAVVVTRYFGGILLGTGGLVKAYQSSVQLALETLPVGERLVAATITLTIEHRFITSFKRLLQPYRASVIHQEFSANARFTLSLPEENIPKLARELQELTSGSAQLQVNAQ